MIFVTAGTQLPFDRLVKTIDKIAAEVKEEFIVQALDSGYKPQNFEIVSFISSTDFNNYIDRAKLIISHAGTGTIISALVKKKPIIVMPRLVKHNEHRNEHQLATAEQMDIQGYVHVAYNEQELETKFMQMWPNELKIRKSITNEAPDGFIESINRFIKF